MNVKIARIKKKLTQDQVCKVVGIGRSTLSKIENGKDTNVSKEIMLKLATVLESSVMHLFFSDEN